MDETEERRPTKLRVSSIPLLQQLNLQHCSVHPIRSSRATPASTLRQWADFCSPHTALLYPSEASTPLDFGHQDHHSSLAPLPSAPSYTSPSSSDTETVPVMDSSLQLTPPLPIHTLVVLDGSWRTVQQILFHNPLLQPPRLRHVRLDLSASACAYTSHYQRSGLRQEPAANCVSTAEAIALALLRLEPPNNPVGELILNSFQKFVQLKTEKKELEVPETETFCSKPLCDKKRKLDEVTSTATSSPLSTSIRKNSSRSVCHAEENRGDKHYNHSSSSGSGSGSDSDEYPCGGPEDSSTLLLLRSKGVKEKQCLSKSQKRKCSRKKEKKRRKK